MTNASGGGTGGLLLLPPWTGQCRTGALTCCDSTDESLPREGWPEDSGRVSAPDWSRPVTATTFDASDDGTDGALDGASSSCPR